jgi:hypothetical protein
VAVCRTAIRRAPALQSDADCDHAAELLAVGFDQAARIELPIEMRGVAEAPIHTG